MRKDREEAARREGMAYALKIVKNAAAARKDPVKELEDECEYRGAHITPLAISRLIYHRFMVYGLWFPDEVPTRCKYCGQRIRIGENRK